MFPTGHMAKDCPPEQGESSKKKVDLARFAYTMCYDLPPTADMASRSWAIFLFTSYMFR
jgi:hypothetical protein